MQENVNSYEKVIEQYRKFLLDNYKKLDNEKKYAICKELYEMLYMQAETYSKEKDGFDKESRLVKICIVTLIPILENAVRDINISNELMIKFYELYEQCYYFAGRRSFKHFLGAIEFKWKKKVFKPRFKLFEPIIYYLNKMALDNDIRLLRISMPPGYAKSVTVTAFTAFLYGLDITKSVLRVSSSDILVKQFGRDTVNLMLSEEYRKIFPQFIDNKFTKKTEDEFMLQGANERNFLCKTRDSNIVGFRIDVLIEDDLIGGTDEALNNELLDKTFLKHMTDWTTRTKNDDTFRCISIGTMFNPDDLLCRLKELAESKKERIPCQFKKYVEVYKDKENGKLDVFITIPALDENDKSTLESEFSTKYFLDMRESLLADKSGKGNYFWQCVFQQNPISPTGLTFNYDNLQTYDELPKDEKGNFKVAEYCVASLDPNRKGNDYIAMPVFVPYEDKYYLIDFLFKQGAMSQFYDEIVEKIIKFNIRVLYVENNVDTSLATVLRMKLKERGYNGCEIREIYSLLNKEQRIKDNQGYVKDLVVFPKREFWGKINHELKTAMEQIISYSFDKPNKHDDGIDAITLFIMENIPKINNLGTLEIFDRRLLNI